MYDPTLLDMPALQGIPIEAFGCDNPNDAKLAKIVFDLANDPSSPAPVFTVVANRLRNLGWMEGVTQKRLEYLSSTGFVPEQDFKTLRELTLERYDRFHTREAAAEIIRMLDGGSSVGAAKTAMRNAAEFELERKKTNFKDFLYQAEQVINKPKQYLRCGLPTVNGVFPGLPMAQLTVLGAPPSHGKSLVLGQVGRQVAVAENKRVLYCSLEDGNMRLAQRFIRAMAGVPSSQYGSDLTSESKKRIRDVVDMFPADNLITCDSSNIFEVAHIARLERPDLVIIDQLSHLTGDLGLTGREKDRKKSELSAYLKAIINGITHEDRALGIPVLLAHQINREGVKAIEPTNAHLADAAEVERDADNILLFWRTTDPDTGRLTNNGFLKVSKQRDGGVDKCSVQLDLSRYTMMA